MSLSSLQTILNISYKNLTNIITLTSYYVHYTNEKKEIYVFGHLILPQANFS
jgi:hypothetical protein